MESLFVYGTLGPGRPNAHILENIGGKWQEGHVGGSLLDKGWVQRWVIRELCWMTQVNVYRAFFSPQRIYTITGTYSMISKVLNMNGFR